MDGDCCSYNMVAHMIGCRGGEEIFKGAHLALVRLKDIPDVNCSIGKLSCGYANI